jgi:hypothetical protein
VQTCSPYHTLAFPYVNLPLRIGRARSVESVPTGRTRRRSQECTKPSVLPPWSKGQARASPLERGTLSALRAIPARRLGGPSAEEAAELVEGGLLDLLETADAQSAVPSHIKV